MAHEEVFGNRSGKQCIFPPYFDKNFGSLIYKYCGDDCPLFYIDPTTGSCGCAFFWDAVLLKELMQAVRDGEFQIAVTKGV